MKNPTLIRQHMITLAALFAVGCTVALFTTDVRELLSEQKKVERSSSGAVMVEPTATVQMIPMRSVHRGLFSPRTRAAGNNSAIPSDYSFDMSVSLLSKAQVHEVAGGAEVGALGTQHKQTVHQVGPAVAMPITTFYSMATTRQVSQPGATSAPQMAKVTGSGQRRGIGPPPPIGDDDDPENPDIPQPPVPVGDGMAILLVLALAFVVYQRRVQKIG
jgi:hypothetical protein